MILAIDVGGTKTLIALFNNRGEIVKKFQTPTIHEYDNFISELIEIIETDFWQPEITAIGLAVPGIVNYQDDTILRMGNLNWKNVDPKQQLADHFKVPTFIDNDANVGALFAANQLTSVPHRALYITLGTGIGTGVIENGRISTSLADCEGGHAVITFEGKLTIWEHIASGRAIVRDFKQHASEITSPAIWQQVGKRVGLGLVAILPIIQPDVIIVGGGVGSYFEHFREPLTHYLETNLSPMTKVPKITSAKHPSEAVAHGCYLLTQQNTHTKVTH